MGELKITCKLISNLQVVFPLTLVLHKNNMVESLKQNINCPICTSNLVLSTVFVGAWPYILGRQFQQLVKKRVNCYYTVRGQELWIKTNRQVLANEELLISYGAKTPLVYWKRLYTPDQLARLTSAIQQATPQNVDDVIRSFEP